MDNPIPCTRGPCGLPMADPPVCRFGRYFLFTSKSKVMEIAEKTGAIPFDIAGAELNHRDDLCTFDVIIQEYGLTDAALLRMAKVINAADTVRLDADLLAAGFEAIAVGYSLRYPDDLENIERIFSIFFSPLSLPIYLTLFIFSHRYFSKHLQMIIVITLT